jgi:hypothetical protein
VRAFTTGPVFKGERTTISPDQFEAEYMAGIAEDKEFWKSAVIDAELIVELPFWMLISIELHANEAVGRSHLAKILRIVSTLLIFEPEVVEGFLTG